MRTVYIRQVYMGTVGDMKNLEEHYSEMAEKGWLIDKIGLFTHRYRAVEPCRKRFFVDFLPQITAFDYPENEDAQDYRMICEASGWYFLTANKQFHVFCADAENIVPVPIHTDNSIHAKIYLKACRKYELPWFLYTILMLWFVFRNIGTQALLSNIRLFAIIGSFFFSIGFIWTMGIVIRWYIRTRKAAKSNLPMPIVNRQLARIRKTSFAIGSMLCLVSLIIGVTLEVIGGMPATLIFIIFIPLVGFGVGLWIRRQIDTKRRTRAGNVGLTVAVFIVMIVVIIGGMVFTIMNMRFSLSSDSLDNRPVLTLSDVGVTTSPNHSNTLVRGTIAVPVDYEHWESGAGGSVKTQVYRSVSKSLTQWLFEQLSKDFMRQFTRIVDELDYANDSITVLSSDEAAFWGAEKGIAFNYSNNNAIELLLLNGRSILWLSAKCASMDLDTVRLAVIKLWVDLETHT